MHWLKKVISTMYLQKIDMNQNWINLLHISDNYERMVEVFIQFAQCNADSIENKVRICVFVWIFWMREYSMMSKLDNVFCAINFGRIISDACELVDIPSMTKTHEVDWKMNDKLEDMIHDVEV